MCGSTSPSGKYRDIITEERAITRLQHSKQLMSITIIRHTTIEELCNTVFSVGSTLKLHNWRQLRKGQAYMHKRQTHLLAREDVT
jgi:hypothetical protein